MKVWLLSIGLIVVGSLTLILPIAAHGAWQVPPIYIPLWIVGGSMIGAGLMLPFRKPFVGAVAFVLILALFIRAVGLFN